MSFSPAPTDSPRDPGAQLPRGLLEEARETFVPVRVRTDRRLRDEHFDRLWSK
jgi:hypothetical protein